MNTASIHTTPVSAQDASVSVIVKAFADDPAARWMYPDAADYFGNFPHFVRVFGGKAFESGTAEHLDEFFGAALWLPPGVQPDEKALGDFLQATSSKDDQAALFSVFEQMGTFHPTMPHWYLPLIGVDPERQGKGLGSMLLERALRRCDHNGQPAYLEATNSRNVALYERHGFEIIGTIQAGSSPEIVPMLRPPQ
jgi:ribosomal protein S18 acetylase RimI-like enzyme